MDDQFQQFAATETVESSGYAEESVEGIAALGLDPIAMLLQALSFLLIFVIVRKYALGKIVDALEHRHAKIEEGLKNADDIEKLRSETEAQSSSFLRNAHAQADDIIAKAHEEAGAIVASAEDKAQSRAQTIVENAKLQAEQEIAQARQELKSEIINLVSQAATNVLDEKLDSDQDKQLIKRAIESGVTS